MRNMKKNILKITLLLGMYLCGYSQIQYDCNPTFNTLGSDVFTCNNVPIQTVVPSCQWTDTDIAKLKSALLSEYGKAILGANGIEEADLIAPANTQYNCHAYAWHLTEGNANKVRIHTTKKDGTDNLNK